MLLHRGHYICIPVLFVYCHNIPHCADNSKNSYNRQKIDECHDCLFCICINSTYKESVTERTECKNHQTAKHKQQHWINVSIHDTS